MKLLIFGLVSLLGLPLVALGGIESGTPGEFSLPHGDLAAQVLEHPRIRLSPAAASDVRAGIPDPRVLAVLLLLASEHTLDWVGPMRTGHSYFVKGTQRVSYHVFGRAVDIIRVDGAPVSDNNAGALVATRTVLSLPRALRPDQVGSPWMIPTSGVVVFTRDHHDHLHFGWSAK